ncbi:MAG: septum formation initiator family protein [Chitinophagaceae bacterium]|nr:septum formation initiator family protein [Chitinophagaceae bacterium]
MENNPDQIIDENLNPEDKVWVSPLSRIPRWLRNKFFIAAAMFMVIILFLDKNDLFTQADRGRQLKELLNSKQYFTEQIATEQGELDKMKSNPGILEKYAREKYLMKRDNEDLFIIPENYEEHKN